MTYTELLRDSEFAANIPTDWHGAVAVYVGGSSAAHVWTPAEVARFPNNRKLPVWVAGTDGTGEAFAMLRVLYDLGVPSGAWVAVDMETRIDRTYVTNFGDVLNRCGYRVWVYGSASTVFGNPQLDGYWVADYAGVGPFMYDRIGAEVRATQYASPSTGSGGEWDSSTVKEYTYTHGVWWH